MANASQDSNLPSTIDIHGDDVDATPVDGRVLQIRALTTILHHVHPQAKPRSSKPQGRYDHEHNLLSRLATLLVRDVGHAVVAVTTGPKPTEAEASPEPTPSTVQDINKQPVLSAMLNFNQARQTRITANSDASSAEVFEDLKGDINIFCLKYGHGSPGLTHDLHARNLARLIALVHQLPANTNLKGEKVLQFDHLKNLKQWVYFFSMEKVNERLYHGVNPQARSFFQLIKDIAGDPAQIVLDSAMTRKILRTRQSGWGPAAADSWIWALLEHGEESLVSLLNKADGDPVTLQLLPGPRGMAHIQITSKTAARILLHFVGLLDDLATSIRLIKKQTGVKDLKKLKNQKTLEEIRNAFNILITSMEHLHNLTYKSVSFWDVMHIISPALMKDLPEEVQDKGVDQLRQWLKCLCAWEKACIDVVKHRSLADRFQADPEVKIYQVNPPVNKNAQASLDEVLHLVESHTEASNARDGWPKLLATGARCNAEREGPSQKILTGLDNTTSGPMELEKWRSSFVGQVHCESALALMLAEQEMTSARIGVSKLCCLACSLYLEALGFEADAQHTSGQVFAWSPPEGTPGPVLDTLVTQLAISLAGYLDSRARNNTDADGRRDHRETQSPSGSDSSGSPDPSIGADAGNH